MIILGIGLLVIGLVAEITILQTLGVILAVAGVAPYLLGATGHAIAGRRHHW